MALCPICGKLLKEGLFKNNTSIIYIYGERFTTCDECAQKWLLYQRGELNESDLLTSNTESNIMKSILLVKQKKELKIAQDTRTSELKAAYEKMVNTINFNTKNDEFIQNKSHEIIWINNKTLYIIPSLVDFCNNNVEYINNGGIINIDSSVRQIIYDDIIYYEKTGDIQYTSNISGKGGGYNLKGAVIGGLIAGSAGAVIGSRNKTEIKTITEVHDSSETIIYYRSNGEINSYRLSGYELYKYCKKMIPEKDLIFVANSPSEKSIDPTEEIRKYKKLLDDGIISEEEFSIKKKQLLDL